MSEQVYKILIIDDSAEDRVTFRYYLQKNKDCRYEFLEAELGETGVKICLEENPDCVLLDFNLPDSDGLAVMREINPDPLNPEFAVVLLTGSGSEAIAVNALKCGAQDYLVKGKVTAEDLHLSIQKAIEVVNLRKECQQTLKDLQDSQQFVQSTMDALTSQIVILNKTGVIVSVNEAWRKFALENDFQAENFGIGQNYFSGYNPLCRTDDDSYGEKAIEGIKKIVNREAESFEFEYPCHSPIEECWYSMRVTSFSSLNDDLRVVVSHENITSRKIAQEKLRISEERLNLAMKGANIGTFDWNIKTDEIVWSREIEEAAEMTTADFNDSFEGLMSHIHPLDREILQSRIAEGIETGEYECEFRMLKGDGTIRWVLGKGRVFYDEHGEPARLLGVDIDITNRKLTEEELRENQRFMQSIIETAPSVLYTFDLNTLKTTYLTKQMANALGYEFDELKELQDRIFEMSIHPDDFEAATQHFEQIKRANNDEVFEFEYRIQHKSGEWRWFRSRDMVFKRDAEANPEEILGVALDITERKLAEEKLHESRERMAATNTNAPIGIVETTLEGNYLNVNDEFCRISGYSRDELLQLNLKDVTHEEDFPRNFDLFKRLVADEFPSFQIEKRYLRKDGSTVWAEVNRTLLKNGDGKPSYVIGAVLDITERKNAADQLRRNHDTFFNLVANAPFGIYVVDKDFRLIQISKGSRKVFSSIESLIGRDFAEILRIIWQEPFATEVIERFRHTLSSGNSYRSSNTIEQRGDIEDTEIYDWKIERITLPDGEFGVVCYFYDLTERLEYEEKLRESEARFRSLFDSIDEGFCIIEMIFGENEKPVDYRFLQANAAFNRLTGLPENAIGKTAREFLPNLEEFWFETYGNVALTGIPVRFENKSEPMNCWFDVYASRMNNHSNCRVAIVFNNITERKLAELERKESFEREQILRQQAEDANRAKDEFLAVLSHELRSPLNAMLGWAIMLKQGIMNGEQAVHAVNVIERNIRLQNSLIEDLLDASRIISGKMRLEPANISFISVVQNALDTARQVAEAKGIELAAEFDPAADEMRGDIFRLQQIIGNLLTNAIKFTPENGTINVKLESANDTAKLIVKDNGIGISAEILPHIFERFQQADGSTKRQFGGLGLGLTIVKHLTEMHGGRVSAESDGVGKGATFTLELPLIKAVTVKTATTENVADNPNLPKNLLEDIKLLIVDDDADARDLLQFILEKQGARVTCLGSAFEALQELEKTEFDLLISDLGMAGIDGYDLIRRVRRNEKQEIAMNPAIALTGYVSAEDRERVLQAGFQTHLPKPLEFNKLFAAALELIKK